MIYDNISRLCQEKNITISALERELGIGNGTIGGWRRSSPRIDKLALVANYFGITIDDLVSAPPTATN